MQDFYFCKRKLICLFWKIQTTTSSSRLMNEIQNLTQKYYTVMTPSYHKYKHICVLYLRKYCILFFPKMKPNPDLLFSLLYICWRVGQLENWFERGTPHIPFLPRLPREPNTPSPDGIFSLGHKTRLPTIWELWNDYYEVTLLWRFIR